MKIKTKLVMMAFFMAYSFMLTGCKPRPEKAAQMTESHYGERYRPQFHFSPETNWMNDPNGMVYYDGTYHLFYQHYPDSNVWGPMHWGHAVSTDLVHWKHLPVALYPDSLGTIFSGSAVVDLQNTTGLGTATHPALVAIYTSHHAGLEKAGSLVFQNQCMAYSTDKGMTWTKYPGNPVLKNPGIRDFRDPKVFRNTQTGQWNMILAVQDRVHICSSPDLIHWKFESEFGSKEGAHGGVWECPDLFPLKVKGTDITKWVMLVSINPGGPNRGSATQYFVGEFDGHRFTCETAGEHWVDWGRDNYAGVTWSNVPESDGRKLFLGWMSNWQYATVVPTTVWRSAMTLPRELSLLGGNGDYLLISNPAKELETLRSDPVILTSLLITGEKAVKLDGIDLNQVEMVLDFRTGKTPVDSFGIVLANDQGERLVIRFLLTTDQLVVDRSSAGLYSFSNDFSGSVTAPWRFKNRVLCQLFIDAASAELFVDGGEVVLTNIVFPTTKFNQLYLYSYGGSVLLEKGSFYNLERIW